MALTGDLSNGEVFVAAQAGANATILAVADAEELRNDTGRATMPGAAQRWSSRRHPRHHRPGRQPILVRSGDPA